MRVRDAAALIGGAPVVGDPEVCVSGLSYDSRRTAVGDLFVCVRGFQVDGHKYALEALKKGARALVVEEELPVDAPQVIVPNARRALALLAAEFAGRPGDRMLIVGITGTNGKTSTAHLCREVLRAADKEPGLIGTIHAQVGDQTISLGKTTPEAPELHRLLGEMERKGQDAAVMEVSSHALALERTYRLPFDVAVFTNLSHDHLDFHKDLESYFQAKLRLFLDLGTHADRPWRPYAVVNSDDAMAPRILKRLRVPYVTYGFSPGAHVRAEEVAMGPEGATFDVVTPVGQRRVELKLAGRFSILNALAAISVGLAQRLSLEEAAAAVESVAGIRGRFELVREGQDFTVVVDYAHTPEGLRSLLSSARDIVPGKLITVFGCGGDRDRDKRPVMGRIAGELSDLVIVTSDNPRSEEPECIAEEIRVGLADTGTAHEVEVDRAAAITRAISEAGPQGGVVIAGKGHETVQIFRDHTLEFDDAEVARKAIRVRRFRGRSRLRTSDTLWTECRRMGSAELVVGQNPRETLG